MAVNKLAFAAAGDQSGFAQNLEMMRNGRWRYAPHRNDFPAVHVLAGGDGFINPQAGRVCQGFGNLLDPGTVHGVPQYSVTNF